MHHMCWCHLTSISFPTLCNVESLKPKRVRLRSLSNTFLNNFVRNPKWFYVKSSRVAGLFTGQMSRWQWGLKLFLFTQMISWLFFNLFCRSALRHVVSIKARRLFLFCEMLILTMRSPAYYRLKGLETVLNIYHVVALFKLIFVVTESSI